MSKSAVYSWRLSTELKHRLEARARADGVSLASLVEAIVREWLTSSPGGNGDREARRVRDAAERCFGSLAGRDPARSRSVSARVRAKLAVRRRTRDS
jgi:hypothetical protein